MSCNKAWPDFSWSSAANKLLFFAKDWASAGKCKAVSWGTDYSALDKDGYKKCVCGLILSKDDVNC